MALTGWNVTLAEIEKFCGAHQKNFNKGRPTVSAAKCGSMILVSRNTKYMRIGLFVVFYAIDSSVRRLKYNRCYMQPFANCWRHSCNMRTYLFRYGVGSVSEQKTCNISKMRLRQDRTNGGLIGSRIRAFDWYQNQWHWITLNGR